MVLERWTKENEVGFDNCWIGCFAPENKISVELTQPHLDLKKSGDWIQILYNVFVRSLVQILFF